jgi:hypothetical protein
MAIVEGIDLQNPGSLLMKRDHMFVPPEVADQKQAEVAAAVAALQEEFLTPEAEAAGEELRKEKARIKDRNKTPPDYRMAHDCIIDQILIDPAASYGTLAKRTGYSRNWISMVLQSDSFQAKLAQRQAAIIDPLILASIKERLFGAAGLALDIMTEKLEQTPSMDNAIAVFNATVKATGMGQQAATPVILNQYIARIPEKSLSAADWAADNAPTLQKQNLQAIESTEYTDAEGLGASASAGTGVTEPTSPIPDPFAAATATLFQPQQEN